ncbi:MAG: hypothetical protein ACP5M4_13180 [Acidobacteriaceae bacterium]
MPHCAATLEELLADFNLTAARWQVFFADHPQAADAPTDIVRSINVAEPVWHLYAASYRHSELQLGHPVARSLTLAKSPDRGVAGEKARIVLSLCNLFYPFEF